MGGAKRGGTKGAKDRLPPPSDTFVHIYFYIPYPISAKIIEKTTFNLNVGWIFFT